METIKKLLVLLGLSIFLVCSTVSCSNEPEIDLYATISGQVTDMKTGEPLSAAAITLTPGGYTTVSGSDGTFEFVRLDPGQYTIIVQMDGYVTNRKIVNAVATESHRVIVPLTRQ